MIQNVWGIIVIFVDNYCECIFKQWTLEKLLSEKTMIHLIGSYINPKCSLVKMFSQVVRAKLTRLYA